jgi:hypothetical protein
MDERVVAVGLVVLSEVLRHLPNVCIAGPCRIVDEAAQQRAGAEVAKQFGKRPEPIPDSLPELNGLDHDATEMRFQRRWLHTCEELTKMFHFPALLNDPTDEQVKKGSQAFWRAGGQ